MPTQHVGIELNDDFFVFDSEDIQSSAGGVDLDPDKTFSGVYTSGSSGKEQVNLSDAVADYRIKLIVLKFRTDPADYLQINADFIQHPTGYEILRQQGEGLVLMRHEGYWCVAGRFYASTHRNSEDLNDAVSPGVAASIFKDTTYITNTVASGVVTLADGLVVNQIKHFIVKDFFGGATTITITPSNFRPGVSYVFNAASDLDGCGCIMQWDGSEWNLLSSFGGSVV